MIRKLESMLGLATEFFQKVSNPSILLPNETLEDVPLEYVPISTSQVNALLEAITNFGNGDDPKFPYPPNPLPPGAKRKTPLPLVVEQAKAKSEDWFWLTICPIPHKGQKKVDYDKSPDTILGLYTAMKSGSEEASKRLWGFAKNWNPEPRQVGDKTYPVTDSERVFREALDAFVAWEEKHGKDTKGQPQTAPKVKEEPPTEERSPFD